MRRPTALLLGGLAALAALPLVVTQTYLLHMVILILFYIALTAAWNILTFSGKVSLGHCAFFGLGAYTSTILLVKWGVIPWIGLLAGIGVSLLGALTMTVPLLRLRGPMFSLATIAYGEVLRRVAILWRDLTAGSEGLTIPFTPGVLNMCFTSKTVYYYMFLVLAIGAVGISYWLYHSATGFHLRATASDEEAAQALGIDTNRVQVVALMWSAGITGALGVFYAQYVYMIDPDLVFSGTLFAIQPALNGIIGGLGTVWGPVLGAALMTPLGEFLRSYLGHVRQGLNFFIYGVTLIVVVMVLPGGIISAFAALRARLGGGARRSSGEEAA
ncbi:MAG: branched-chain amino acid ABC transporter permease [Candidatus Methylomirabilota bacterium]